MVDAHTSTRTRAADTAGAWHRRVCGSRGSGGATGSATVVRGAGRLSEPPRTGGTMSKTTITIDARTRAVLTEALLEPLGQRAEQLQDALTRPDREQHPERAANAYRRTCQVGGLLERIDWGMDSSCETLNITGEEELALLMSCLRGAVRSARESERDSQAYGDAEEAARAMIRLHDSCEALLNLEAQAIRAGDPGR